MIFTNIFILKQDVCTSMLAMQKKNLFFCPVVHIIAHIWLGRGSAILEPFCTLQISGVLIVFHLITNRLSVYWCLNIFSMKNKTSRIKKVFFAISVTNRRPYYFIFKGLFYCLVLREMWENPWKDVHFTDFAGNICLIQCQCSQSLIITSFKQLQIFSGS